MELQKLFNLLVLDLLKDIYTKIQTLNDRRNYVFNNYLINLITLKKNIKNNFILISKCYVYNQTR